MGTRSTIKFYEDGQYICSIYQQYDGYPEGVGLELAKFLRETELINGFSLGDNSHKANGIRCLIAQYIAKIKVSIGGVYMTTEDDSQEYNYIVECSEINEVTVTAKEYGDVLFKGGREEFLEFCDGFEEGKVRYEPVNSYTKREEKK